MDTAHPRWWTALSVVLLLDASCGMSDIDHSFIVELHHDASAEQRTQVLAACRRHRFDARQGQLQSNPHGGARVREAKLLSSHHTTPPVVTCHVTRSDADAHIAHLPGVARVTPDSYDTYDTLGCTEVDTFQNSFLTGWNLRRLTAESDEDMRARFPPFAYSPTWGAGADVYVIDSGCLCQHDELAGRCIQGFTAFHDGGTPNHTDIRGHGTHVAGIVAGSTVGVARGANVICLKVDNGEGPVHSASLEAFDWIRSEVARRRRPSVINRSITGDPDATLDAMANDSVSAGVPVVNSAGNHGSTCDSCDLSPTRAALPITVGSVGRVRGRTRDFSSISDFSCRGACIDIFAAGDRVVSLSHRHPQGHSMKSGTSMAAPAVSGMLAAFLAPGTATAEEGHAWLMRTARQIALNDTAGVQGSPHLIAHMACHLVTPEPAPRTPWPTREPIPTAAAPEHHSNRVVFLALLVGGSLLVGIAGGLAAYLCCKVRDQPSEQQQRQQRRRTTRGRVRRAFRGTPEERSLGQLPSFSEMDSFSSVATVPVDRPPRDSTGKGLYSPVDSPYDEDDEEGEEVQVVAVAVAEEEAAGAAPEAVESAGPGGGPGVGEEGQGERPAVGGATAPGAPATAGEEGAVRV